MVATFGKIIEKYSVLEIKETTDTASTSFSPQIWQHSRKIYDKWDNFDFKMIIFPFLFSNIPVSPAYGVYIS